VTSKRLQGTLRDSRVVVPFDPDLAGRGYGVQSGDSLELSLLEAAYLVDRGDLVVVDESGAEVSFEELVKRGAASDPSFWVKLNVYSDLRNRGLRVQPLEGTPMMLVERKTGEGEKRYALLCLEEGVRIGFKELESFVRRAVESRREPVLAIVDKEGNISYYVVERMG